MRIKENLVHMLPGSLDILFRIPDAEPDAYFPCEQMDQGRELYVAADQVHFRILDISPRVVVGGILREDSGGRCVKYESVEEFDGFCGVVPAVCLADGFGKIGEGALGE